MRILEVENLSERREELQDVGWFIALQNSVQDSLERFPSVDRLERDLIFERENNCQVNYRQDSEVVRSITFMREEDYTMFILKWA